MFVRTLPGQVLKRRGTYAPGGALGVTPEFTEEEGQNLHGKGKGLKSPKDWAQSVCVCVRAKKDRKDEFCRPSF